MELVEKSLNDGETSMDKLKKIIQNNILNEMNKANISMRQLSADINCSESYVQKLLNGDLVPTLEKLNTIAEYFGVPIWTFFLAEELTTGKLDQINTYLLTFDEKALDATLNMVRLITPAK